MLKEPRIRSKKHLKFIASLPSCISGIQGMSQAAHIRSGCFSLGMKPGDNLTVPLTIFEHLNQHKIGEQKFWEFYGGIDNAKKLANDLFQVSGNKEAAHQILAGWK
jgi:hypothetical protein